MASGGERSAKRHKASTSDDTMDTSSTTMSFDVKARAAIVGAHIGDALGFPYHWYYSYDVLQQHMAKYYRPDANGWVHGYQEVHPDVKFKHPDSFKYFRLAKYWVLSNIVQDHDKKNDNRNAWASIGTHYHHNLKAGDTTITVQLARLLLQSCVEKKGYDFEHYLQGYAKYFESPQQHRDTYIEVPHQHFMTQRAKHLAKDYPKQDYYTNEDKLQECAMAESCLSGHTLMLPLVVMLAHDPEKAEAVAQAHVALTHYSKQMADEIVAMCKLMCNLLNGAEPRAEIKRGFYEFQTGVGTSSSGDATAAAKKRGAPGSDAGPKELELEELCLLADKDLVSKLL